MKKTVWSVGALVLGFAVAAFAGQRDVQKDRRDLAQDTREAKSDRQGSAPRHARHPAGQGRHQGRQTSGRQGQGQDGCARPETR